MNESPTSCVGCPTHAFRTGRKRNAGFQRTGSGNARRSTGSARSSCRSPLPTRRGSPSDWATIGPSACLPARVDDPRSASVSPERSSACRSLVREATGQLGRLAEAKRQIARLHLRLTSGRIPDTKKPASVSTRGLLLVAGVRFGLDGTSDGSPEDWCRARFSLAHLTVRASG